MGVLITVPKGKPWTREEEKQLRELRGEGCKLCEIAATMSKSEEAVMKKLQRLGLKVVQRPDSNRTTTSNAAAEIILPKELYNVEEALVMLAGAMKVLQTPGLSKTEVMRLRSLIQASSVYQAKFVEYVDYRGIEKELFELRKKYEDWLKRESAKNKPVEAKQEPVEVQKQIEDVQEKIVEANKEETNVVEEKRN